MLLLCKDQIKAEHCPHITVFLVVSTCCDTAKATANITKIFTQNVHWIEADFDVHVHMKCSALETQIKGPSAENPAEPLMLRTDDIPPFKALSRGSEYSLHTPPMP